MAGMGLQVVQCDHGPAERFAGGHACSQVCAQAADSAAAFTRSPNQPACRPHLHRLPLYLTTHSVGACTATPLLGSPLPAKCMLQHADAKRNP